MFLYTPYFKKYHANFKKNERAFVFAIFLLPSGLVLNLFVGKWI